MEAVMLCRSSSRMIIDCQPEVDVTYKLIKRHTEFLLTAPTKGYIDSA